MPRIIAHVLIAGVIVLLGGFAFVYSGLYGVAATEPHWPVTRWVLDTLRTRSIKVRAAGIEAPSGLDDRAKILIGVGPFRGALRRLPWRAGRAQRRHRARSLSAPAGSCQSRTA